MKKMLALALVTLAAVTAGAWSARPLAAESSAPGEVDEALVNAKIDARLKQQLASALQERVRARSLRASR